MLTKARTMHCIDEDNFKVDLAIFIQAIINGDLELTSKTARELLHGAKGTALWKEAQPTAKIRPIAAPSLFYSIAQTLQLNIPAIAQALLAAMGPSELAYKVKGASEILSHALRALINSNQRISILHLDVKNAFGNISRAAVAEAFTAVFNREAALKPLAAALSATLSPISITCPSRIRAMAWLAALPPNWRKATL
jgi:hypothetical protein